MRDATKLNVYFTGDKTLFLIPLYQRKYAWKRKHCERLFADLLKVSQEGRQSHFFGSIVTVKASETEDDLLIIDGQQRITTISLMILAAIKAVKDGIMECEKGEEYLKDTANKYLMAKYRKVERKIKLRPIDKDRIAYDALFTEDGEIPADAADSGIIKNFQLFYELIKLNAISFDDLIEAIEKLIIIDIRLDSGDNPQMIFESLNSCGKDLEEADKVRNYLLMSLTSEEQERFYYKYWAKIESCTDDEPTMFIRDFLTVKTKVISNITELYFDFKKFEEEYGHAREDLLAEMLKYAEFYRQVTKADTKLPSVDQKLKQLGYIGSTVCMPYYIQFLDYAKEKQLDEKEIFDVFDTTENYWARRIICGYPANVMSRTFAILHSDILRIVGEHNRRGVELKSSYCELMKHILLRKQGNAVFPSDIAIREAFPTRQIYKIPIEYRHFLFERMENENSKERNDTIVPRMRENKITIEHIMPQTLTAQWKADLRDDWQNIYDTYLHTFANLTLTGYNSSYGNHSFTEKKEGYIDHKGNKIDGFKDSAFRLSNYLKTIDKWTVNEIRAREQILLASFLSLWPQVTSDYIPLEAETEVVSFNDDELELTGRTIVAFSYKGLRHPVVTWKNMLVQLCKLIYSEMPIQMNSLAKNNFWLHVQEEGTDYSRVADGCYVYSSCSTRTKCSIITYIFEQLEINPSNLEFELVPLNDKVAVDATEE